MAISPRLIRRRIKSVTNTKKITKAMELVSASKMRRSVGATLASRRYAHAGTRMIGALADLVRSRQHPLLGTRTPERVLVVLVTSHRGLAGGFNANIIKKAIDIFRDCTRLPGASEKTVCSFIAVGRKGEDALRRMGKDLVASFQTITDTPTFQDATPIAALIREEFVQGKTDRVFLVYTDYLSAITQKPVVRQLLPITSAAIEQIFHDDGGAKQADTEESETDEEDPLLFEPSRERVLDVLLPRMVDIQVYQGLLESSASEHSARMLAMKNATGAASDMIDDLTFIFNQARQAAITREISEIAAGKAAVS